MLVVGVVSWWWIGYSVLVPSGYHCGLPSIRDNGPIPTPEVQFPVRVALTRGRPSCAARLGGWAVRACLPILNWVVGDDLGMVRDGVFSDEVWAVVEPLLPSSKGRAGRPWTDHRRALEGIAWRYRTGSPWRDLPVEFGPWQTVWERHFRWSQDGTYQRIFDGVRLAGLLQQSLDPELEQLLSVDSTVVRAHQHAAGARRSSIGAPGPMVAAEDTGGTIELHEFAGRAG